MKMSEKTMAIIVIAMAIFAAWVVSLPKSRPVAQPPAHNSYLDRLAGALEKPLDNIASSKELQRASATVANGIADAVAAAAKEEKKKGGEK